MLIDNSDFFIWPTTFSCVLVINDLVIPNDYNLKISMMPSDTQSDTTSVGLKKIKQFISKFIQNSIIINRNHPFLMRFVDFRTNTVQLPVDPDDYSFASFLFHKLNSISKNYFTIQQLTIDSSVGDRVQYRINESYHAETEYTLFDWWTQNNVNTNNIDRFPSWEELDISSQNRFSPIIVNGGKCENKQV